MGEDEIKTSSESAMEESLPLGIHTVKCHAKNRCTFPIVLRNNQVDRPIWLFYDTSRGRAIVIFDQKDFSEEFPDILLTQVDIDKQGKILLPEGFLESHNIALIEGNPIRFVSVPGRDGKGVIEIYFSDELYQKNVAEYQQNLAKKVATILTTPQAPLRIVPATYSTLKLTGADGDIFSTASETASLTS